MSLLKEVAVSSNSLSSILLPQIQQAVGMHTEQTDRLTSAGFRGKEII